MNDFKAIAFAIHALCKLIYDHHVSHQCERAYCRFLRSVKAAFKGKELEITITEAVDETDYLLKSEANRGQLLSSMEKWRMGRG